MLSATLITYEGKEIVPIQFLERCCQTWQVLRPRTKGQDEYRLYFYRQKDGKDKTYYLYNVCDHQACYKEVGSQAISYTTGVPAMIGAMMLLTGRVEEAGRLYGGGV